MLCTHDNALASWPCAGLLLFAVAAGGQDGLGSGTDLSV